MSADVRFVLCPCGFGSFQTARKKDEDPFAPHIDAERQNMIECPASRPPQAVETAKTENQTEREDKMKEAKTARVAVHGTLMRGERNAHWADEAGARVLDEGVADRREHRKAREVRA